MSDTKNEAVRLLEEISSKLSKLISISKAQGNQTASTLQTAPTLESVLVFAREIFCEKEIAEIWFHGCEATGWQIKGSHIVSWKSALRAYSKTCARNDKPENEQPATKPTKMDSTIISEAQRAGWIKDNRSTWLDAGSPCDISQIVRTNATDCRP